MGGIEDIARERMKNTGEDFATALQTVVALREVVLRDSETDHAWLDAWIAPKDPEPMDEEGLEWLVSRPEEIRSIIRRFPPGAVVCLKPGKRALISSGVVASYCVQKDGPTVSVMPHPESNFRAFLRVDDLVLLGCARGWTPLFIASIIPEPTS